VSWPFEPAIDSPLPRPIRWLGSYLRQRSAVARETFKRSRFRPLISAANFSLDFSRKNA